MYVPPASGQKVHATCTVFVQLSARVSLFGAVGTAAALKPRASSRTSRWPPDLVGKAEPRGGRLAGATRRVAGPGRGRPRRRDRALGSRREPTRQEMAPRRRARHLEVREREQRAHPPPTTLTAQGSTSCTYRPRRALGQAHCHCIQTLAARILWTSHRAPHTLGQDQVP